MALVLDTGPVLAALNDEDPDHERCAAMIGDSTDDLVLPSPVLVELEYWISKLASVEAWLTFCEDIDAGAYSVHALDPSLLLEAARLQARYVDLTLGLVGASVFVTCEWLGEEKVATLDRRHFSVLKTREGKTLQILPEMA